MTDDMHSDLPGPEEVARERERRFLVSDANIIENASWKLITQGYFPAPGGFAARVRIVQHLQAERWVGETAYLGVKGPRVAGERWEEEFPLKDLASAKALLSEMPAVIQKRRYSFPDEETKATWEVDVFLGENAGLVIAELEGVGDWIWDVAKPSWALREITFDTRYNNEQLAFRPIHVWAATPDESGGDEFDPFAE